MWGWPSAAFSRARQPRGLGRPELSAWSELRRAGDLKECLGFLVTETVKATPALLPTDLGFEPPSNPWCSASSFFWQVR